MNQIIKNQTLEVLGMPPDLFDALQHALLIYNFVLNPVREARTLKTMGIFSLDFHL